MRNIGYVFLAVGLVLSTGCNSAKAPEHPAEIKPVETSAPRIYVTNEVGGDLTVIDSGNYNVLATVPLGKRPRARIRAPRARGLAGALVAKPEGKLDAARGIESLALRQLRTGQIVALCIEQRAAFTKERLGARGLCLRPGGGREGNEEERGERV